MSACLLRLVCAIPIDMFCLLRHKTYSLKRSKSILRHATHLFLRKRRTFSNEVRSSILDLLHQLDLEIRNKNRSAAHPLALQVEALYRSHLKKSSFEQIRDLVFTLGFALVVAVLVRQMWFEFYEIPTGSMRPTFKEQDRLVVSKTDFGINVPLKPNQFLFEPSLVNRSGIIVFTGENMDIRDVDTMYFYLIPGKKQYIKRLMGKPGDILYFYGGLIYGINSEGKDISHELQLPELSLIEHIPFIDFDRKQIQQSPSAQGYYSPIVLYQMNEPVAKLSISPQGKPYGEMLNPPNVRALGAPPLTQYADMWGFKNYGMTRLLTREQVRILTNQDPATMENGLLYLEIRHHPSFQGMQIMQDEFGRKRPVLGISVSVIPLQAHHLDALFASLYTARFEVKGGFAFRYGTTSYSTRFAPHLPDVPDGTYEFYYGKAYKISWQGISHELPSDHPLYRHDPERLQLFYNMGIELDTRFEPQMKYQRLQPARYTYYRNRDLYLLGSPILKQNDPTLTAFEQREEIRKATAQAQMPYSPFLDEGAPLNSDGSLNVELIKKYGLLIPPKVYLGLGDNHAMSADSREFGFIPGTNLRGGPDFIFWPPGPRWGTPNQPAYPFFNWPRTIVWILAALSIAGGNIYWKRRHKIPD